MRRSWWAVAVAGVLAVVVAVTTAVLVFAGGGHSAVAAAGPIPATTHAPVAPAGALRVVAVQHATAATTADRLGAVSVTFSAAVADSVTPSLTPALAGTWTRPTPTTAVFVPDGAPAPGATVTLTLPAGTAGTAGGRLAATYRTTWSIRGGDPARLQQLLAETGWLPLSFTPAAPEPATVGAVASTEYAPVAGAYAWRFAPSPAIHALYTGAASTVLVRGAVLAFQSAHHLAADGTAGPAVWAALTADVAAHRVTTEPYVSVSVSKNRPETLTVYENGRAVLSARTNTGIAAAPTPDGSYPIYLRLRSQTMTGTNPDGSHYVDAGVPWISYFLRGDAVHGFIRPSYGSPQSLGCVELPFATAAKVWALLGYGDIVTIAG